MAAFTWRKKKYQKFDECFLKVTEKMYKGTPDIKLNFKKRFNGLGDIMENLKKEIFVYLIGNVHIFQKITTQKRSRMIFYATYYEKNNKRNVRNNYYLDKQTSLNDKKKKSLLFHQ